MFHHFDLFIGAIFSMARAGQPRLNWVVGQTYPASLVAPDSQEPLPECDHSDLNGIIA